MMNLIRSTELPEMNWIRKELSRLEELWRPFDLTRGTDPLTAWAPAVDIAEDDHAITIKADLPEVEKKDIQVNVENGVLTIKGERKRESEEKKKSYHRIERSCGSYMRSFSLPEYADKDKITAEAKNGVLTITIPKKPETKSKAMAIDVK